MSASEKLKALKETGFTCEHWTDFNASDLDVTDELIAVVEAAERAERKLWYEYRRGQPVERIDESWAEGEALAAALAALDAALTADGKTPK